MVEDGLEPRSPESYSNTLTIGSQQKKNYSNVQYNFIHVCKEEFSESLSLADTIFYSSEVVSLSCSREETYFNEYEV